MEIELVGYKVLIDDEDYERITNKKWYRGARNYIFTYVGRIGNKNINITLHRYIMGCSYGDNKKIDHINRNALDNRKCNLRYATTAENNYNTSIRDTNTSGYKGVIYNKINCNYSARIMHNNKLIQIGTGETAEVCARMYDMIAIKLFGDFAATNFNKDEYNESDIDTLWKRVIAPTLWNNTSGYRGVVWHKFSSQWMAAIRNNYKRIYLGYFSTPEEAARAYDKKAKELHGDKAKLNFPEEYKNA